MLHGRSPFSADREHLHHLLRRLGLSSRQTLAVMVAAALLMAGIGIAAQLAGVPPHLMFYAFMVCFCVYFAVTLRLWRSLGGGEAEADAAG